tara:strand:+ start:483 stop:995 length:513 start_codon:yes stop_codon:yes gene_type:complete
VLNYTVPLVEFRNYIKQDIGGLFGENETPRNEENWVKGYLYDTTTVKKDAISKFNPISNFENVNFDRSRFKKYLNKIKSIVEANGATLICLRSPYPPSRLALSKNQDENNYFKEHVESKIAPYYDLNSFKTKNKYIYKDEDFADYHHPNIYGAKKASNQLVEIIKTLNQL